MGIWDKISALVHKCPYRLPSKNVYTMCATGWLSPLLHGQAVPFHCKGVNEESKTLEKTIKPGTPPNAILLDRKF
jgi:hypothetical protein